jgi:hypothetical protein
MLAGGPNFVSGWSTCLEPLPLPTTMRVFVSLYKSGLLYYEMNKEESQRQRSRPEGGLASDEAEWRNRESAQISFRDQRLKKRFNMLLGHLWKGMGATIPLACAYWANTKASYGFLDNDRVSEQDILGGHFQATGQRFAVTEGPALVLHDTSAFLYEREHPELIGYASSTITAAERRGLPKPSSQWGVLMHSSLAITIEGLSLGLTVINSGFEKNSRTPRS